MALNVKQQQVLATLQKAGEPLTAYNLLDRLHADGFSAPIQVYRALDKLAEQGLVHRLETLNAYVSCRHHNGCKRNFKAFAICDNCGHVDEFVDSALTSCLAEWMKSSDFSMGNSTIEIHGRCASCTESLQKSS